MRSLLQLFARFGGFFLFVLLEGICFYLIVQFNKTQGQIWFSSANAFVGAAYDTYDGAVDYLALKREIRELMEENARLRKALEKARPGIDTLTTDTARIDSIRRTYTFIPADVISNSINRNNNTLTLDKGRRDGVEPHMGVISDDGVIGIVRAVSANYASVGSILHRDTRISASIRRTGSFGSLVWRGNDPRYMELEAIPKHADIKVGDIVETSGFSAIFPSGLRIGTVKSVEKISGGNFYDIKVELDEDLSRLKYAYVVNYLARKELSELEAATANE